MDPHPFKYTVYIHTVYMYRHKYIHVLTKETFICTHSVLLYYFKHISLSSYTHIHAHRHTLKHTLTHIFMCILGACLQLFLLAVGVRAFGG